ncbi:MAG: hypothetical protein V4541_00025 [Bacteroidota bacterium]
MELDTLTDLLAKPTMVTEAHVGLLTSLVEAYPYYQPLHLLLAKASAGLPSYNTRLTTAALYNGGSLLHRFIYQSETFDIETQPVDEQETFEEIAEIESVSLPEVKADEQEVFEEIAEIDPQAFAPVSIPANVAEPATLTGELALESIVAADFFAFEKNFNTEKVTEDENSTTVIQPEEYNFEAEAQSTVSKYDDDKLPYTFLWWLAKTRKEHEQIFQPYVTPKQQTTVNPNELQQQYVEHIFHLQSPLNITNEFSKGPVNLQAKPKGIDIINSFIKNDPQIKAPKADQINNENKAKKSAEDNYDLVSETLAAIYIEQMLYHKAIDTYEKLSLKFPEKSRYFADLIQSLEKKI